MTDPYVGLRPYERTEAGNFFGRASEIRAVHNLWLANRLLVVYGGSGSGKTSLIQAGVLPSFQTAGPERDAVILPVGQLPHGTAYPAMPLRGRRQHEFALLSAWSPQTGLRELVGMSLVDLLRKLPEAVDRYGDPLPLLAVIDQFEELFAPRAGGADEVDDFLRTLAEAIDKVHGLHLLISIREDSVSHLLPYETRIAGHSRARFQVGGLTPPNALEAVTGPVRATTRSFAPGVAARLVNDLRTVTFTDGVGDSIPVVGDSVEPAALQVVCEQLWATLPPDVGTITIAHLKDRGDVDQMLLDFCRATVHATARVHGIEESEIWAWLARTFVTDTGRRGTVYEGVTSTGGLPNEVAQELVKGRVLRAEERAGSRWYELLHDRLIAPIRTGAAAARTLDAEPGLRERIPVNYLRTAETAFAHGEYELAERYARAGLAITEPDDPQGRREALFFLGRIAAAQDDPQAEGYFREAERFFQLPRDARAISRLQLELGRLYLGQHDLLKAQIALEQALRGPGDDPAVRIELARVLRAADDPRAALGYLQAVFIVQPDHVEGLIERGLAYAAMDQPEAARADLQEAIRHSPAVAERADVQRILAL